MSWKLGLPGYEQNIPRPDSFKISPIKIERAERTASGRLVKDVIAKKKQFQLSYKGLDAQTTTMLEDLYYDIEGFLSFVYESNGIEKNAIVDFTDFDKERLQTPDEYWKVDIVLEEQ